MSSAESRMAATANPSTMYDRAQRAAQMIRSRAHADPSVAVVLGSGLGSFADDLAAATRLSYVDIPGFARVTVEGHAGQLVIGKTGETVVAAMQGRFHFYEGYSLEEVTFQIRVLKRSGLRTLLLTNAPG